MLQINCMEYNKQMHAKKVELEEKIHSTLNLHFNEALLWQSAHIGFITVLYFFTGLIVILFRIFTFSSAYFWLVSSVFASFSSAFIFQ